MNYRIRKLSLVLIVFAVVRLLKETLARIRLQGSERMVVKE